MRRCTRTLAAVSTAGLLALTASPLATAKPVTRLELSPLVTHSTGQFDEAAAEIPAFDPATGRVFVVNAQSGAVDVLDARATTSLPAVATLSVAGLTAADGSTVPADAVVNSISIHDGVIAVAVENAPKTERGWVHFFTTGDLVHLGGVRVGVQPDMVTFTPSGDQVVTANEAEPADDFSVDPEGSISIIDARDLDTLRQGDVRTARFTAYDSGRDLPAGVRVFGPDVPVPAGQEPAGRVARNLEPEYVAVDHRSKTAYVTLQEANAVAVVDLRSAAVRDLWSMGGKDWSAGANILDASDKDKAIALANRPVTGLYMPDTIKAYAVKGQTYLVMANEGDAREWGSYAEPVRLADETVPLCADVFPDAAALRDKKNLGRLNVSTASGIRADGLPGGDRGVRWPVVLDSHRGRGAGL